LTEYKQVIVLEAVLTAHAENVTLSVLDLILLNEIASQATLHSITKHLIDIKLIKTELSKNDARRKYVLPTKLGIAWINDCSEILASAAK
jgi:DNA-binding MarR family transcriptional regulator